MTRMSIKLLRGVNLVATDRHWVSDDSSDPYCKIYVNGNQIARTPVLYKTTDPIWGGPMATFEFDGEIETTEVVIEVYDFNEVMKDVPMGQVSFKATEVLADSKEKKYPNVWLPVQSLNGCKVSGEVQVRLLRLHHKTNLDPRKKAGVHAPGIPNITEDRPVDSKDLRESAIVSLSAGPKLRAVGIGHNRESLKERIMESRCPVTLHVYDVSNDGRVAKVNAVSRHTPGLHGGGIFHAAIEVYGREYSFGGSRVNTTGIFACRPRKCPMHHYRESQFLGDCDLTPRQVDQILRKMKPEWMAPTYDLFRKNCCFFSKEFAIELGVGHIPEWVYCLADMGAAIDDYRIKREKARKEKEENARIKAEQEKQAIASNVTNMPKITHESDNAEECVEITESFGEIEIEATVKHNKKIESHAAPNRKASDVGLSAIGEEHAEVHGMVNEIETGVLDNVMATRVQRAYRVSMAAKKRRDIPGPAVHQRQ